MTTPIPAEVGHGSKEPTIVEIDGFRGRLIRADHADCDTARAVWNGGIDRRPRLIARCVGTADVVAAVRFARDHDLEIAIRAEATTWRAPPFATTGSSSTSWRCGPYGSGEGVYVNFLGATKTPTGRQRILTKVRRERRLQFLEDTHPRAQGGFP